MKSADGRRFLIPKNPRYCLIHVWSVVPSLSSFLRCGGGAHEVADNFGSSSESLTAVLIFPQKKLPAFEVGPRGLLHSVSGTSNVSLICGDGREYMFSPLSFKPSPPLHHLVPVVLSTNDSWCERRKEKSEHCLAERKSTWHEERNASWRRFELLVLTWKSNTQVANMNNNSSHVFPELQICVC